MSHYPGGDSIRTFIHLFMGIRNHGFYQFDYSREGKLIPYNFSNAANVPLLLIHGEEDLFIIPQDALWCFNQFKLAKKDVTIKFYKHLGHMSITVSSNYTKIFLDDTAIFLEKSLEY